MDPRRQKKSEEMGDDARKIVWTLIGAILTAGVVNVGANSYQIDARFKIMEQRLIGAETEQDLKIQAIKQEHNFTAQKLSDVGDKLGALETMFYQHTTDNSRHIIKP